ncbi:hypothetical protein [Alteromonas confluentis]|uniref:Uncharacterized protein n=1 Tax=Alteromonas confluentis TaxID=1656094 RepID=A0A1E7ZGW8_9ALTE|nr:hypothetical protein [Alteromonas confluentis]OFC72773.1 hypothetical protein BFC18_00150 [Alteromonas confluentis]
MSPESQSQQLKLKGFLKIAVLFWHEHRRFFGFRLYKRFSIQQHLKSNRQWFAAVSTPLFLWPLFHIWLFVLGCFKVSLLVWFCRVFKLAVAAKLRTLVSAVSNNRIKTLAGSLGR